MQQQQYSFGTRSSKAAWPAEVETTAESAAAAEAQFIVLTETTRPVAPIAT
jgi:hypothetical protein